ncbi:MAG TPA: hypothetical protein VF040_02805 [Ktedonobacterales bacterium]
MQPSHQPPESSPPQLPRHPEQGRHGRWQTGLRSQWERAWDNPLKLLAVIPVLVACFCGGSILYTLTPYGQQMTRETQATQTAYAAAVEQQTATARMHLLSPTTTPAPVPTCLPDAVNCNPWGYNFTQGNRIYKPPAAFCDVFSCVASFWDGSGYVVECQDGIYSKTGGRTGSCGGHGGENRALLAP